MPLTVRGIVPYQVELGQGWLVVAPLVSPASGSHALLQHVLGSLHFRNDRIEICQGSLARGRQGYRWLSGRYAMERRPRQKKP